MRLFRSTKANRNVQRVNAMTEIASAALIESPIAQLPLRVAQGFTSMFAFFHPKPKTTERLINLGQALLALTQTGLLIAMQYNSEDCELESTVCKSYSLCQLIYQGLLLTGWGASELIREPYATDEGSSASEASPRV